MRDIKFSIVFPSYHPRKGDATHFVEKIWTAIDESQRRVFTEAYFNDELDALSESYFSKDWTPKRTTIRSGHRWKKGDLFVPKIWTGKPYRSKPIAICEPLEILDVMEFMIDNNGGYWFDGYKPLMKEVVMDVVRDDGFDQLEDFENWFNMKEGQTFEGQRIRFA